MNAFASGISTPPKLTDVPPDILERGKIDHDAISFELVVGDLPLLKV